MSSKHRPPKKKSETCCDVYTCRKSQFINVGIVYWVFASVSENKGVTKYLFPHGEHMSDGIYSDSREILKEHFGSDIKRINQSLCPPKRLHVPFSYFHANSRYSLLLVCQGIEYECLKNQYIDIEIYEYYSYVDCLHPM